MREFFEKFTTSLILIGFLVFGGGTIIFVINISQRYGVTFEIKIALIGLTLLFLGVLAARIFSEVGFYEQPRMG